MKQQIRGIGNDRFPFQNQNIKRSYLICHIVGDAVNVAPATTDVDLTKLRITLDLEQGGKPQSSGFNAIAPTVKGAIDDRSGSVSDLGFAAGGTTCSGVNMIPEGGAVKQESYLLIPLVSSPMILKGNDKYEVSIDVLPGFFSTAVDADSKLYLVTEDGTDLNQMDVELPYYYPVPTDRQSHTFSFPGVSEITLIDSGTSAVKSACAFSSIEIASSHYKERFDTVDMFALNQMDQLGVPSERLLNFPILRVNPSCLNDVKINIGIDTANVVLNNQWIHVQVVNYNSNIAKRAIALGRKVNTRKAMKRGLLGA